ncbi:hypothetical protein CRUP_007927 [Coryphaenoides rupestris]|nr:hypothetical protein CRUP_007927 [Coryphaenoides rupestris]
MLERRENSIGQQQPVEAGRDSMNNTLSLCSSTQVLHRSRLSSPGVVLRGEPASQDPRSPRPLFEACSRTLEALAQENQLLSGPILLSEDTESQLYHMKGLTKELREIQLLEGLLEGWLEHESGVQALRAWLTLQEDKLKKRHRIEDVASVQSALKDCQVGWVCQELEELVKEKEKDVEKLEERGSALIQDKKGEACSVVRETLKGVNQSWTNLDHMISQMKVSLRSVLEQWTSYRRAAEEISGYLMEGRYSVSRLRLLNGSLEAVQQQVASLESLQEEMDKQESSLRNFGSVTHQLLTECHPSVAEMLNRALRDVNIRWNSLLEQISEQLRSSKALLGLWQSYRTLDGQCVAAVQKQEDRANRLLKSATDRDITEEESTAWISDCDDCLGDQAPVQQSLRQLHGLGERLKSQVDASCMASLQSDQRSLAHRLATLEHALHRHQEILQSGSQNYEGFREQLDTLCGQALEAEQVLREAEPLGTPEPAVVQGHMDRLKLSSLSPDLERLNELAYRLPLSDRDMKRLQGLNRSWASHSAHLTERFSKLQAGVLQHQSFLQKCEAWMDFLSQTEQKLAAEISGNYLSLLEQQRDHEAPFPLIAAARCWPPSGSLPLVIVHCTVHL